MTWGIDGALEVSSVKFLSNMFIFGKKLYDYWSILDNGVLTIFFFLNYQKFQFPSLKSHNCNVPDF